MSYQYLLDGISDFIWCRSLDKGISKQMGFAYSNSGELLKTKNGGLDWEKIILKKENFDLTNFKGTLPDSFKINQITESQKGIVYFLTSSQHILKSQNCDSKLIVLKKLSIQSKYKIKNLLINKKKPSHLLCMVEEIICFSENCQAIQVLYYLDSPSSSWLKLMEDVETAVWTEGIHSFGILVILNESVNVENDFDKTVAVYSSNFFIDKFRYKIFK